MLSKKRSRPIVVEGINYRWAIAPNPTYVVFVAELADTPMSKIEVYIGSDIDRMWIDFPNTDKLNLKVIKPKDAASIITQAINQGWDPNEKSKPLVFDCLNDATIELRVN